MVGYIVMIVVGVLAGAFFILNEIGKKKAAKNPGKPTAAPAKAPAAPAPKAPAPAPAPAAPAAPKKVEKVEVETELVSEAFPKYEDLFIPAEGLKVKPAEEAKPQEAEKPKTEPKPQETNKPKSLNDEMKHLSPEMKAILITDILKRKE